MWPSVPVFLPLYDAAEGLGVVLDHEQVVLLGERHDRVHVADVAVEVHRHDRLGPRRDQLLGRLDADAVVVEVHVGEAGNGAGLDDREAGGDERVAGHDHLVAGPDAQGGQGHVQGRGAGGRADGELAALPLGELLLELHALAGRSSS